MSIFTDIEDQLDFKPVKMAELLGISKSYYSMLRKGERTVSKQVAIKLKDRFGVKLDDSLCPSVHNMNTNETDQSSSPVKNLPKTG